MASLKGKSAVPWWLLACCLLSARASTTTLEGTWEGALVCHGTEYAWKLVLQERENDRYAGESTLTAGDQTARHRVSATFDPQQLRVKVTGKGCIDPLPGRKQIRFRKATFHADAQVIRGQPGVKGCEPFVIARTSTSATLTTLEADTDAGPKPARRAARRGPDRAAPKSQKSAIAADVDCEAIIAWSRVIEEAYPGVDFNASLYNRLSDLFMDRHFEPVFGISFAATDESTRRAIARNKLGKCFRQPELEKAGNWQRRKLSTPFTSPGMVFSFDDVVLHMEHRAANRAWLKQATETLAASGGSEAARRELVEEGRIRYIGLWPAEKAAFRAMAATALPQTQSAPSDPAATHFVYPDGGVQPQEKIIPIARSLGAAAGSIHACGFDGAVQFKAAYLEQIRRLAPTRMQEAEDAFDASFEEAFTAEHRCPLKEQLAAAHRTDVDQAYARLDNLLNARRSDARGNTREEENKGVPSGFYLRTLRIDDPDETYARNAAGETLTGEEVLDIGQEMGRSVINLRICGTDPPEGQYRKQFVAEARRLVPWQAAAAGKRFDRGVKSTPFGGSSKRRDDQDPCAPAMLAHYEQAISALFAHLASYAPVSRSELIATAEAEAPPLEPGIFDPVLFASIRGEVGEVNRLGRGLPALEAGVIWHRKYTRRYESTAGPQFALNRRYLMVRRGADVGETSRDLVHGLAAAKTNTAVDLFMRRYLGIQADQSAGVAGRFFSLATTRKIEILKQAEFERIATRNAGAPKASGAVGELEIMEAYVRSRWKGLNFQRILSPHSIGFQNPLEPFHTMYVTTVTAAEVHQCEQLKADRYRCVYSFESNSQAGPKVAGYRVRDDLFRKQVLEALRGIRADHDKDLFVREADGWYSPDMVQRYRDAIRDLQEEIHRAEEEARRLTPDLPPDF